jgi:aminopeptidase N
MKNRTFKIAILTAAVFFLIGFRLGLPVYEGKFSRLSSVFLTPAYISENQNKIDILHYDIHLDLNTDEKSLKGDVTLTGIVTDSSINQIDLNFYDNFTIEGVWLNGDNTPYVNNKTRLTIPSVPGTDTFSVRVVYEGRPVRAGLSGFVFGSINKNPVVYNINEPVYASTWFPCNDLPTDKAQLRMSVTNDKKFTSVSNGKLVSVDELNGKRTYIWETVYPISTYLIAVYSAEYVNFNDVYISRDGNDTMNIEYYAFPNHVEQAKIDFFDHPEIMKFFSETFGEYPFIKEKYGVAEFLWQIGAMENQTITGIGSNFVGGNRFFNDIYVHELAHSWWGNAVGPETWADIWLNEGFATYSEALYSEHKYGEEALISTIMSKFDENFSGALYNPGNDLFSNTIYSKGAWVLHMLRWEMGDSLFFNLLRTYYESYKYKTASTKDFQQLTETFTARDYTWFFNQWVLEGEDQINLDYSWEYEDSILVLKTKQVQKQYNPYYFSLEIEIVYPSGKERQVVFVNKTSAEFRLPVKGRPAEVQIDPFKRLLANYNEKKL